MRSGVALAIGLALVGLAPRASADPGDQGEPVALVTRAPSRCLTSAVLLRQIGALGGTLREAKDDEPARRIEVTIAREPWGYDVLLALRDRDGQLRERDPWRGLASMVTRALQLGAAHPSAALLHVAPDPDVSSGALQVSMSASASGRGVDGAAARARLGRSRARGGSLRRALAGRGARRPPRPRGARRPPRRAPG